MREQIAFGSRCDEVAFALPETACDVRVTRNRVNWLLSYRNSIHPNECTEFRWATEGPSEWWSLPLLQSLEMLLTSYGMPAHDHNSSSPAPAPGSFRGSGDAASFAPAALGYALFATRWLQAPLYFGLVAAQGVYVYKFFNELWKLIGHVINGYADETYVMLAVLKLVDVVMIANLLIMTIVGGYETFVSRINLQGHRDQPEWLSHVNSNVLKVKLATAIVGISSVHLL